MSPHVVSILVLVAIFVVGTLWSINLGALALVACFLVGTWVFGKSTDDVLEAFPAQLFVILVGVTFLFSIAKNNGTIDWLVQWAVRAVRGHVAAIPWVMFVLSGLLVALGALSPAAIAIIAPIGIALGVRYGISPLLMGLMVVHGSAAGNFSPLGVLGVITNGIVERSHIPGSPTFLFLSNALLNLLIGIGIYVAFGGWQLLRAGRRSHEVPIAESTSDSSGGSGGTALRTKPATDTITLNRDRTITVFGMVALVVGALVFAVDIGLLALSVAVVVSMLAPASAKGALAQVSWNVVLLICGIVTYIGLLESAGTVRYLGEGIAAISAPALAALVVCFIGAVVSAFASTTGILGALIPLAVPLLATGHVGAIGLVAALSVSSSVVDASPFSTNGALVIANTPADQQAVVYRRLMVWGFGLVLIAPIVTWALLVWPGWW
ncbi:SLC13 family permease [Saccharopolyspora shandongensis]|uniref:SLC13 family permease n=1 Tax=Saccharopolyspora shandongensis TaxID=418495 RepID=UPI0033DA3BFA